MNEYKYIAKVLHTHKKREWSPVNETTVLFVDETIVRKPHSLKF